MPREGKLHIGFFGKRNNGKSTLINFLTGQDVAIVSATPGTTADPVRKAMEIQGLGAAILIDTAGFDDAGELGEKRVSRTMAVIDQIDLAVLVVTNNSLDDGEAAFVNRIRESEIPFIAVHTKEDVAAATGTTREKYMAMGAQAFVAWRHGNPVDDVVKAMGQAVDRAGVANRSMLGDIIRRGDVVLLVTPIDAGAPEGRMILPQVQTIRDTIDNNAVAIVLKETEVRGFLASTGIKPRIVITDSQIFPKAAAAVPDDMLLTSFSILLARYRGSFEAYKRGTPAIWGLKDGDRVLMLELCTHHASCDDIGRIKLPHLLKKKTGKQLEFEFVSGFNSVALPIAGYALVIQCGGCVATPRQLRQRLKPAIDAGVPVTNYGMALACLHGIYERAMRPFENME